MDQIYLLSGSDIVRQSSFDFSAPVSARLCCLMYVLDSLLDSLNFVPLTLHPKPLANNLLTNRVESTHLSHRTCRLSSHMHILQFVRQCNHRMRHLRIHQSYRHNNRLESHPGNR